MAQSGFDAASDLRVRDAHRDSVSRAYYAVFARVTGALIDAGQTPRPAYGTWPHGTLPEAAAATLLDRRAAASNLAYSVRRLYRLRLIADYRPDTDVDARTAFEATGLMAQVFRLLKEG